MDISDISRIANRKNMTAETEKLRKSVARETEKILKFQLAQNTAYWDLHEKLQQLEAQRDRLQQNLIELQMQYEAISAQYQDELRRNPEIINSVNATREDFTTLEEYIERLLATVGRIKKDKVVAENTFEKAAQDIQQIKDGLNAANNRANIKIRTLKNNLAKSEEHEANVNNAVKEVRARAEALESQARDADERSKDVKTDLRAVHADRERLAVALQQVSQNIANLRTKIEKDRIEFEATNSELKNTMENMEKGRNEALRSADEERTLREAAEIRVVHFEEALNNLEVDRKALIERAAFAEKKLLDLETILKSKESEIDVLAGKISVLETENNNLQAEREETLEQCENKIKELTLANQEIESEVAKTQAALNEMRELGEKEVQNLKSALNQKDLELANNTSHIDQLMVDLNLVADNTARMEATLRDANNAARAGGDRERALQLRANALETTLQEKTNAVEEMSKSSRQLASDNDRLQEKAVGLQNTIDNIQKELKDGARCEVPDREEVPATSSTSKVVKNASIYDYLLSDNSEDYNPRSYDPKEIERRFEALQRGETFKEPIRTRGEMAMDRPRDMSQDSSGKRVFHKSKRQPGKKKSTMRYN